MASGTEPRAAFVRSVNSRGGNCHHESESAEITFQLQVTMCYRGIMPSNQTSVKRRSGCPLNASVEMLGDRWSLLIIRDMMLRGFRTYKEFMNCYEGIATNILADRLRKLIAHGILTTQSDPTDGRKLIYTLTQ